MDKVLFWIVLAGIMAGQLVQIPIMGRDAPLLDLAVMVAVVVGSYYLISSGQYQRIFKLPIFQVFLILISVLLVSLLANFGNFSLGELALASLFWVRFVVYGLLVFIFYATVNKVNLNKFKQWLVWLFVTVAVLGFIQLGVFPSLEIWEYLGWDPHHGRLFSTFLDPNFVGIFLSLGLGWVLIFHPKISQNKTYFGYLLSVMLIGLAILFTFSRSALLVTAVVVAIITLFRRRQLFWIFLGVLIITIAVSPRIQERVMGAFTLDDTTVHRIVSWQAGVKLVVDHPLFGVGYNTLPCCEAVPTEGRADSGFDSSLLTITATAGWLGLLSFLWFVVTALKTTWHGIRNRQAVFSFWFIAATGGLFVGSFFLNAWLYPPLLALWFMMLGLSLKEND